MPTPPLSNLLVLQSAEAYKREGLDGFRLLNGLGQAAYSSRVRTAVERGMLERTDRKTLKGQPMPSEDELRAWLVEKGYDPPASKIVDAEPELAAREGYAPGHWEAGVAPGYMMGKVTVQRDAGGQVVQTWERQSPDDRLRVELIERAVEALVQEIRGLSPVIPAPAESPDDLMVAVPIGDPHFGLYVWSRECGDDFDTEIARKLATGAIDRLVASGPMASVAVLLPLGDILHADDQSNQTPAHRHQLDVDTRFVRVLGIVIETYRHTILRMLEKYPKVIVRFVRGNHDPHAVWALAYAIAAYFENNPRVEVDLSPANFWYYRFGKVLIGATHGDTVKQDKLPGLMAADKAEDWGATQFRYFYTGHVHSKRVWDFPGVQCESFRTLAAQDAYAAYHGYRAGRDMVLIVHHKNYGEIERHRVDVGMLKQ